MEHLQIAYDLFVIMIGLAALSIVVFWAARTRETDLRDFSILYACFTLVLMLKKYLSLNVEDYSARAWYALSGLDQTLSYAVIVALIHFLTGVYHVRYRRAITIFFLVMMFVSVGLLLSPTGAVLDPTAQTIRFGTGYRITTVLYFLSDRKST